MTARSTDLVEPPPDLAAGEVQLHFSRIIDGDSARDLVPFYHFRIITQDGQDAGHINFRVGDTDHIRLFAGHLGFEIAEPFRGRGWAAQACRAIAPFVRTLYDSVIITCDPDNLASRRTMEKLGAQFLDEVSVARPVSHCDGIRTKRRYEWSLNLADIAPASSALHR
jgi:predicted acetyltransferase